MNDVITSRQSQLSELCKQYGVRRLAVFGSVLRDDFDPSRSDIDFVVDFETSPNDYFALLEALTELFERKVDLVVGKSIKNPYFKRQVEASQELLYAA